MNIDIRVPEVGESITGGVLIEWFKADGELVAADDPLFELETDKITMQVQAEAAGRLSVAVAAGTDVEIGQVVGTIDTSAAAETPAAPAAEPAAESAEPGELDRLSPAVRRMVVENEVDPRAIEGSGKEGRITSSDVVTYLERVAAPSVERKTVEEAPAPAPAASPSAAPTARPEERRETRLRMSSLRKRVAERLVEVQQTAAILSTFNEADMSAVLRLRARYKQPFAEQHGVRLGFMSFFAKAAVEALKAVPALNARIEGDAIVQNHYYDIGVAVGTDRGLVVPVVRDVDRIGFAELERRVADLAARARDRKLELSDLQGGCFTLSNGGVYGSLLSTPILNPPQSGILGMHAIKKRPIVVDDEIVARPMMYLAVSYDHRIVDGSEAVTFLRRIVDCIESPERMLLEV